VLALVRDQKPTGELSVDPGIAFRDPELAGHPVRSAAVLGTESAEQFSVLALGYLKLGFQATTQIARQ
jgi:hypothetical protein